MRIFFRVPKHAVFGENPLVILVIFRYHKADGTGVCDSAAAVERDCKMFDWHVPAVFQNETTVGRPVLMEAFHIETMDALDVPCEEVAAKVPLRESGEDDSQLFVLEPNQDGHKEHHAGKCILICTWAAARGLMVIVTIGCGSRTIIICEIKGLLTTRKQLELISK